MSSDLEPLIISYSGIRGIAGRSLTPDVAARFGRAFGQMVAARHGTAPIILLGRDTRASGPALTAGLVRGLAPFATLVDLGVVPTPTVQFAMTPLCASGAVCVTASHNPARWNGMKFFLGRDNTVLDGAETAELCRLASSVDHPIDAGHAPEIADRGDDAIRLHIEKVCSEIAADAVRARRFRVAVDSAAGAGTAPTRALLHQLSCEVVDVASGRESEPVPEQLGPLCAAVLAGRCDLGLAQDLDADRLALVTENGRAPGEESTLVIAVDHLLRRFHSGVRVVVKNVATTRAIDDLVERHGARLIETPVGEIHLSRALLEQTRLGHIAFGGEGNGGVIYPRVLPGRDSLMAICLVLECLAQDRRTLSERLAALPCYHMAKARLPFPDPGALDALLARVEAMYPDAAATRDDGLKLRFPDGAWLCVRMSNTEPVIRIAAESTDPTWAARAIAEIEAS